MSAIQIKGILKGDKRSVFVDHQRHRLFVGGNRVLLFENYQEAEAMIATINKFLTSELYELMNVSAGLYAEYALRMMYLSGSNRMMIAEIYSKLHRNVAWVLEAKRDITYTWNTLQRSCRDLENVTGIFLDYDRPKRSFHAIRAIEFYEDRLNAVQMRMDQFPAFSGPFTVQWY